MKKLIYGSLFLAIVGIGVIGCKKKEINPINKSATESKVGNFDKEFHIASDGNVLIFENSNYYEKIISNLDSTYINAFYAKLSEMNFTSLSESKDESNHLINDEYLASILNKDYTFQIGNYLYRVNKAKEKVYVLSSKLKNEYQDLINENINNKNISVYSTEEDVIELVEAGRTTQEKGLFCNEDHLGNRYEETSVFDIPGFGGVYQFWGDSDYRRYGVYYSIVTTARSSVQGQIRIYIQLENVWHHQRCGNTVGPYSHPWYQSNPSTDNFQKHKSYSGSKALNGLHTKFRIRCEVPGVPQGGNTYSTYFTEWRRIQGNNPYFP